MSVNSTTRRFAISDIHGCCRTFRVMVEEVLMLTPNDTLYLLGDYIDRGPDSKGVIDYIWQMQKNGINVVCLQGNHEEFLIKSYAQQNDDGVWLRNGGEETLLSFGAKKATDIPVKYIDFLCEMQTYIVLDDYVLVHAGFALHEPDFFANTNAHLWLRPQYWYETLAKTKPFGDKIVIHGHTPQETMDIVQSINSKHIPAINIDAACVYKNKLCAFSLDLCEAYFYPNIDLL